MGRKISSDEAKAMNAARKTLGGPAGARMPCGWCGEAQSASSMRKHFVTCPNKPGEKVKSDPFAREKASFLAKWEQIVNSAKS